MAARTFTSTIDMSNYLECACEIAVKETAITIQEELKRCIDEQFYNDPGFYPNIYERTEEFLNHAVYQMISKNSAEIFVDYQDMHYKNNFCGWQVVSWASESKHGADYYQTSTQDFWTVFIEWCDENLLNLLKKNLQKQGIQVK